MAAQATLSLHRRVFEHEGAARLGVALGADSILIRGGPDIVVAKGAMNVMAVAALEQALIHLVMKGLRERGLDVCVALIAERRLVGFEQLGFRSGGYTCGDFTSRAVNAGFTPQAVDAVATGATDVGLGVRRAQKVGVGSRVATEASRGAGFFRGRVEAEYFALVAT